MSGEYSPDWHLRSFFERKGIDPVCPLCKHREWAVEIGPPSIDQAYDAYVLHCLNCGFVMQLTKSVVNRSEASDPSDTRHERS